MAPEKAFLVIVHVANTTPFSLYMSCPVLDMHTQTYTADTEASGQSTGSAN